jgi:hypothetical protein
MFKHQIFVYYFFVNEIGVLRLMPRPEKVVFAEAIFVKPQ